MSAYRDMTSVDAPKPYVSPPDGYQPHAWMYAPAGRPGTSTQVITVNDMVYCTSCRRWFRVAQGMGVWSVGTDGAPAISCPGSDWHGPDCNCFNHPRPQGVMEDQS